MSTIENKSRPQILTWLCIGSGIFGVSWIIMLFVLIGYSYKGDLPSGLFPGLVTEYLHAGYLFISAEIVLAGLGIAGIILMWQLNKTGLYLYAISKALIYFLPVLFIGNNHLTFPGLIITSIFIIMYGILIASMQKK